MKKPEILENEYERLKALRQLEILDTNSEIELDRLTKLAAKLVGTPISVISLVDEERQWFKSKYGLDAQETPRDISFCGHAILDGKTLIVDDATTDSRFSDNPLVVKDPAIRSYAGAVITDENGYNLGTLCCIDVEKRAFSEDQIENLELLRDQVQTIFKLRRRELQARRYADMLEFVHRINNDLSSSVHQSINKYLKLGGKLLNLELGICSHCALDNYHVEAIVGGEGKVSIGDDLLLENTYCKEVIEKERTVQYKEVGQIQHLRSHPVYQNLKLESFIGSPIWVAGEVWGTINFSSTSIRKELFSDHEVKFVEIIAAIVGTKLELEKRRKEEEGYQKSLVVEADKANKASLSKSMFLANMSHEIRTPLNSIIGISQILSSTKLDTQHNEYIEVLSRSSSALLSLVNDILDLSKIESGSIVLKKESFNIVETTKDCLQMFHLEALKSGIHLELKNDLHQDQACMDRARFSQILINLIGNALKFTEEGFVEVHLRECSGKPGIEISVVDSGKGISSEKVDMIFSNFTQENEGIEKKYGGTGLGLSITKKLIDAMEGKITVESILNEGSKFIIQLPGSLTSSNAKEKIKPASVSKSDLEGLKVLQIDDCKDNIKITRMLLKDSGIDFFSEVDPLKGLEAIKNGSFDIVLLDIQMPIMNGIELAREYQSWCTENHCNGPIIIACTASVEKTIIKNALDSGCGDYLIKPVMKDNLLQKLFDTTKRNIKK